MNAIALDANAILVFQQERLNGMNGDGHAAVQRAIEYGCIALDIDGACLQEWIDTAEGHAPFALSAWVDDQLAMGNIRLFETKGNLFRALNAIGLPKKDHKWVKLAISCKGRIIVTNDIDFFDPRAKKAPEEKKLKLKEKGGRCSKALAKSYKVSVYCMIRFARNLH